MTKKAKAKLKVTPERIKKASRTIPIQDLVKFAEAYNKVGISDDVTLQLPLHCVCYIEGKGYRKQSVPAGSMFAPTHIIIGKQQGLIFEFEPTNQIKSSSGEIEKIEIPWAEVDDYFGYFAYEVTKEYLKLGPQTSGISVLEDKIMSVVRKNPSMHTIMSKGFEEAQQEARRMALQDDIEDNETFGLF